MNKTWLIAKHDYLETVKKKSFLFITVGTPLLLAGIMVLTLFLTFRKTSNKPIGYVDQAGILDPQVSAPQATNAKSLFTFRYYPNHEAARKALFAKEIQAYYVLPEHYCRSTTVSLYYLDAEPSELAEYHLQELIRVNLVQDLPPKIQARLLDGPHLTIRSADGSREFGSGHYSRFLFSLLAAAFFYIAVMSAAGHMTQAMVIEKENRTLETLQSSASPRQIINGKILGLSAVSLTQLFVWGSPFLIALPIIKARLPQLLTFLEIPWDLLLMIVIYFLPTYMLLANLLITIGVSTDETDQSSLLAGSLFMLFTLPLFFIPIIFSAPNHPFLVALTLLPTCTFITVIMRWSLTAIPVWQLLTSWGLLMGVTIASTWVVSKVFHATMLTYGQKFTLKNLIHALRTP